MGRYSLPRKPIEFKKSPLNPISMEWKPMDWIACDGFFSSAPLAWIKRKTGDDFCINVYYLSIKDILRIEDQYGDANTMTSIGIIRQLNSSLKIIGVHLVLIYATQALV